VRVVDPQWTNRTRRLLRAAAWLALAATVGCGTARIQVGATVHPPEGGRSAALPLAAVLYIEEELRGYSEVASPTTLHGMNQTYQFDVGAALAPVLETALRGAFADLEVRKTKPAAADLRKNGRAGVLTVGLNSSVLDLQFEPKFVGVNARTNYLIDLTVRFEDTAGATVFQGKARGSGFSTVHLAETKGQAFVPGIDLALQEAVDRLTDTVLHSAALRDFAAAQALPTPAVAAAAPAPAPAVPAPPPPPAVVAATPPAPPPAAGTRPCPPDAAAAAPGRVRQAIQSLQVGAVEKARGELELALCGNPEHGLARELLRQLDTPAEQLFGSEATPYQVQPGDSLSQLAAEYLGDPFLFFALARYNRLGNPSRLAAGQTLRIPVTEYRKKPAKPADDTPPVVTASPPGGTFSAAVSVALSATDDTDREPAIHFTLDGSTPTAASQRYTEPLILERTTTLASVAVDAAGNHSPVRNDTYTIAAANRAAADASYARGAAALDRGEPEPAYQAFRQALELDPTHARAQGQIGHLREALVQRYRKQATDAFRQQDLDRAIAGWDKVLELDPANRLAALERARALDLKKKLERFGSQ